jgi:hypothetical protein
VTDRLIRITTGPAGTTDAPGYAADDGVAGTAGTDGTSVARCRPQPAGDSPRTGIDRRKVKQIIDHDDTA